VLLSRLFSVAVSNLFALVALAISMFGLALGALLYSKFYARAAGRWQTPYFAYAAGLLLQILAFLALPQLVPLEYEGVTRRSAAFAALIPFTFAGFALAELLFRESGAIANRYAADLAGAAIGCLVISALQQWLPPHMIAFIVSVIIVAVGLLATRAIKKTGLLLWGVATIAYSACLLFTPSAFDLSVLKERQAPKAFYEKWNNFSYVRVLPYTQKSRVLAKLTPEHPPAGFEQRYIDIDGQMGALLTHYGDSLDNLDYLKDEISNLAYVVRAPKNVALIGIGGGMDVLSTLAFRTPSIVGIELNPIVYDIVTREFAEYAGHLHKQPGVQLVRAEGRSWLKNSPTLFDSIHMAIVPVWASGAAISNTVMQNKLLTVEAWSEMLAKLSPEGILSVTRTLFPKELDRLKHLAAASLLQMRVTREDCPNHAVILINDVRATALVSVSPFTAEEITRIKDYAARTGATIALAPSVGWSDAVFDEATTAPPSDDTPFYSAQLSFKKLYDTLFGAPQFQQLMLYAVFPLSFVSFLMYVAMLCNRGWAQQAPGNSAVATLYFTLTAGGYMLVEIMLMYQIMIFMPEPSDALCVVLFTLLVSGSAGSYISTRYSGMQRATQYLLPAVLLATAALYPAVSDYASSAAPLPRLLSVVALLLPAGFFMGIMLPAGMQRWVSAETDARAWLFAVNCAFSAFMSSAALILVASGSISGTYLLGVACYVLAGAVYLGFRAVTK